VNWILCQRGVSSVLVGARNRRQAEENAKAADFTLTDDEVRHINKQLDALDLDS